MFTVLWDNDGVLVNTEGMYFQACRDILGSAGIELTLQQFQEISLRRGESTFSLATERGLPSCRSVSTAKRAGSSVCPVAGNTPLCHRWR